MKEGNFESPPLVVERQETNLAVDSFDYFVMEETTEEILGFKFAKTVFTYPGSKERTSIVVLKSDLSDPSFLTKN